MNETAVTIPMETFMELSHKAYRFDLIREAVSNEDIPSYRLDDTLKLLVGGEVK